MIDRDTVEKIFQATVFALLLEKGLIGPELVTKMRSWHHSGFNMIGGDLGRSSGASTGGM